MERDRSLHDGKRGEKIIFEFCCNFIALEVQTYKCVENFSKYMHKSSKGLGQDAFFRF